MTKTFSLLSLLLFLFLHTNAQAQETNYKTELDLIFEGLKTKNYERIKPLLDARVKIGTLPQGMNDAVVPQVINQLPEPVSYEVAGIVKEAGGTRVNTLYAYKTGNKRKQSFLFDAQNKITDFDVLGGTQSVAATTKVNATDMPGRFETSFEVHENIIFVKAVLNGKEEYFILDSGAPTLILNADHFKKGAVTKSAIQAQGVGGKADLGSHHIASFNWNGIKMEDFDGITMSLKHLEKSTGHKFAGLIGYSVFKDYIVTFDYQQKLLSFVHADEKGNTTGIASDGAKHTIIPFTLHAHIPVFAATIGGKAYKMGLDCGAGSGLLYAKYIPELKNNISNLKKSKLEGAGKETSRTEYAMLNKMTVGDVVYPELNFAFEDATLSQLNDGYGLDIDGLLGYDFLSKHKTTINLKKGEMIIYQ